MRSEEEDKRTCDNCSTLWKIKVCIVQSNIRRYAFVHVNTVHTKVVTAVVR